MTNSDDNLPPPTSKFFDIIPANKRSQASPTSRPLIANNSPAQTDSMINTDQQSDTTEAVTEKPAEQEETTEVVSQPTEVLADKEEQDTPPPIQTDIEESKSEPQPEPEENDKQPESDENTPAPIQTDIEQLTTPDQPAEDELLLPAEATPDEAVPNETVVIHSPQTAKSFRLRTWLIALLFVVIIAAIGLLLYIYVFKSNATNTPGTQFFGS